jgi:hypothetical protein
MAALNRLPELHKRVRDLEAQLASLTPVSRPTHGRQVSES